MFDLYGPKDLTDFHASSNIAQPNVENIRSGKRPHKLAQAKHFEEPKEWIFLLTKTVVDYKQVEIRIISKDIL